MPFERVPDFEMGLRRCPPRIAGSRPASWARDVITGRRSRAGTLTHLNAASAGGIAKSHHCHTGAFHLAASFEARQNRFTGPGLHGTRTAVSAMGLAPFLSAMIGVRHRTGRDGSPEGRDACGGSMQSTRARRLSIARGGTREGAITLSSSRCECPSC